MRARFFVSVVLGCVAAGSASARQDNVFFLKGRERPQRVVVTAGDTLADPERATGGMVGLLDGVVADLRGPGLGPFLATPMPKTKLLDARGDLERVGVAHLIGRDLVERVELFWGNEGMFIAQAMGDGDGDGATRVSKLDPERFRALMLDWPLYRGKFEESPGSGAEPRPGVSAVLSKPYVQAPFYLDQETLGDRFLRGRRTDIKPVSRVLGNESMHVRLPRGYDPKRPAGLLVWVNAGREGEVPGVFNTALDELGLIAVGIDKVGNDRDVSDRYQLALDAVWTASMRFHVDRERVYLTGLSGGGSVVSMLAPCFPEYFAGSVPIVGMRSYFNVPVGNGKLVRAGYERPESKRWALTRTRRMGPITGEGDANGVVIRQAAKRMEEDGVPIRVFDFPELGHQMPSATQFAQALRWVDRPRSEALAKEAETARAALETYVRKFGTGTPTNDKQRAELVRVTELGPWSEAAWEAVTMLRGAAVAPK